MSNLKKKEPLSAFIAVKTTESMKKELEKLALKSQIEFSNYLRIVWANFIEKENSKKK
ncbi:MAG: hypothetical protein ABIN04_15210 [Ginsengibacter sp.]